MNTATTTLLSFLDTSKTKRNLNYEQMLAFTKTVTVIENHLNKRY